MAAGERVRDRVGLMRVELRHAASLQRVLQAAIERVGEIRVPRQGPLAVGESP